MKQHVILHLAEGKDGKVQLITHFEPRIDRNDSSHVPNDVEAMANKLIELAQREGVQIWQ